MDEVLIEIALPAESDTHALAALLAPQLRPGDVVLCEGEIGAGKTTFCRHVIHTLFGPDEEVPSPTFTLVQTYENDDFEVWHTDLYRLGDPQEIVELGLLDAFSDAICLVEWPDRLGDLGPQDPLTLTFVAEPTQHRCQIRGSDVWRERLVFHRD